jgi:hypothetical protein
VGLATGCGESYGVVRAVNDGVRDCPLVPADGPPGRAAHVDDVVAYSESEDDLSWLCREAK